MQKRTVRLTESAIMLAFATVLSLVTILKMPYGGSVTACSALPLLLIAYRYGTRWGLFTAGVYGLLQMLIGMKNVMYFTTPLSIAAVIVLDYLLAFAVLGLGGVFRKCCRRQADALVLGGLLACVLRYICHTVSGCTIWAGLSIPNEQALLYSLAYNATYMIPETIVTLLGAALIGQMLDFRGETVTRVTTEGGRFDWFAAGAGCLVVATLVYDVREIFSHLQNPDTGDFMITGLTQVSWPAVGIVTLVGAALALLLLLIRHLRRAKKAQ